SKTHKLTNSQTQYPKKLITKKITTNCNFYLSLQLRYLFSKVIINIDIMNHLRKLSQRYTYTSLQLHETIARKAGFSGTDHKYLGFLLQKGRLTAGELSELTGLT